MKPPACWCVITLFEAELRARNEPVDGIKIVRDPSNLVIKIPDPQNYDLFIQKLMDKNLLPDGSMLLQHKNKGQQSADFSLPELMPDEIKSTAPTPFDIGCVRPKGWGGG